MARGISIGDVENKVQHINDNNVIPLSTGADVPEVVTVGVLKEHIIMYIFNVHHPSQETRYFKGKIKGYFEIYDNGTLVRNYVPAYQISTQKYGLLDKVNNVFYISPNGVDFTGPSIT